MYKKLLVPLDGSKLAEVALPYAEKLAGKLPSDITLMYIGESSEDPFYQSYMQKRVEKVKQGVAKYAEKQEEACKVESVISAGHTLVDHPAEEIVNYADKEDIDLIVMATHGHSGIMRWALGSTADKIVRTAKQPVVLIRAKHDQSDVRDECMMNEILVPLDGSEESETVIPYTQYLASKLELEVTLFQVISLMYHLEATAESATRVPYSTEEMKPLQSQAKDYLEKVSSLFKEKGITAMTEVRVGDAAEEIIKLADEINACMVTMSTHGRSGISRWTFGSVANKILYHGNTPLMLVRAAGSTAE